MEEKQLFQKRSIHMHTLLPSQLPGTKPGISSYHQSQKTFLLLLMLTIEVTILQILAYIEFKISWVEMTMNYSLVSVSYCSVSFVGTCCEKFPQVAKVFSSLATAPLFTHHHLTFCTLWQFLLYSQFRYSIHSDVCCILLVLSSMLLHFLVNFILEEFSLSSLQFMEIFLIRQTASYIVEKRPDKL